MSQDYSKLTWIMVLTACDGPLAASATASQRRPRCLIYNTFYITISAVIAFRHGCCRPLPERVSLCCVSQPLRAPLEIGFDYTRSLGPVLSQFITALAAQRILGARAAERHDAP